MLTWADLFWAAMLIAFAGTLIYVAEQEDQRPPRQQWIEDSRNSCVVKDKLELANDQTHVRKDEYLPKILTIYECKNGLKAALIKEA